MKEQQPQSPIPKHIIGPTVTITVAPFTIGVAPPSSAASQNNSQNNNDRSDASNSNSTCTVLATSSSSSSSSPYDDKFTIPNQGQGNRGRNIREGHQRVLCSDRKGFFDGFKPKSFILSSCRVTILQAAQVLSTYITDQLEHETKLDAQLENNEITHIEYESSLLSFEEDEWNRRWRNLFFTNKIWAAIGKFHLLTMIIRCYEGAIYVLFLKKDGFRGEVMMDRLTKDTYMSAIRKSRRLKEYISSSSSSQNELKQKYHHSAASTSSDSSSSSSSSSNEITSVFDLGSKMFYTCFYANAITFLSDLTVQQCILLYGYYKFYVTKQRERKFMKLRKASGGEHGEEKQKLITDQDGINEKYLLDELKLEEEYCEDEKDVVGGNGDKEGDHADVDAASNANDHIITKNSSDSSNSTWIEDEKAILMLSFFRRSTQITVVKGIGLVLASFGGAFGSIIYPGWGTVFGTQMGDAAVGAILDDE